MKTIKICRIKMSYLDYFYNRKLPVPCFPQSFGDFFDGWRLNDGKTFIKKIMTMKPTKFYISSESEIESITSKKELFVKMFRIYNKLGNHRIDKFEIISIIPFILEKNLENVLYSSLKYYCLENAPEKMTDEDKPENYIITRSEFGLFLDCFYRGVHCIAELDENDEVYQKSKDNLIKIAENELDTLLDKIFIDEKKESVEQMELGKVLKNVPQNILNQMKNINQAFFDTLIYYEKKNNSNNNENN